MLKNPLVSVVMPAYNAEQYAAPAIESILSQTFADFELIIIDDGSTDNTAAVIEGFSERDSRIRTFHQPNSGAAATMNRGCALATGKYIARMDADDLSHPQRLKRQVEFLESRPDIDICGTWMRTFEGKKETVMRFPTDPDLAKSMLLFQLSIVGCSIMFTKEMRLKTGVRNRSGFGATDDYLFVVECSRTSRIASVTEPLYFYRIHPGQVTIREKDREARFSREIRLMQLEQLGLHPDADELDLHDAISCWQPIADRSLVARAESWLMKLKRANERAGIYPEPAFSELLGNYWFAFCLRHAKFGPSTYQRFSRTPLADGARVSFGQRMKFLARCLAGYAPARGAGAAK